MAEELFLNEVDDKIATRRFLEARHATRLLTSAGTMTVTGLRLSDREKPENGLVVTFDEGEQSTIMQAVLTVLEARQK